jgi:NAD(P)-dependent dehydrogenase (short-subunit alcohol dehydrogenase family)
MATSGTTVNVICPGSTDTPLMEELELALKDDPRFERFFPGGVASASIATIPLGRLATPADVANGVSFFVRPESGFITGQVLSIDGGQTMY